MKRKTKAAPKRKARSIQPQVIINLDELSPQMNLFIDHYIVCMNGTEAARLAKYSGDDATLAATASRLLRNDKVLREINKRLETYAMSANEVLIHLTDIARGDIADALNTFGGIDPLEAKRRGKSHLIKRFKTKITTWTDKDGEDHSTEETEIEMYDRQSALNTLMKFHGLLVERVKMEDWRTDIIALLKEGKLTPEQVRQELGDEIAGELLIQVGIPSLTSGESE